MTTPHDKALTAAMAAFNQVVNEPLMIKCDRCDGKGYHHGFGEDGASPDWCIKCGGNQFDVMPGEEERAMQAAISAYLSSIGGVVCTREPVGAWYEDGTGCFHMSLNVELEEKKARENGHQIHYFHEPIEAGNGGDGWISVEDKLPGEQGQDSEEVLCFLNGHCDLHDMECRRGGGWGIRLGFYDAERFAFRCGGRPTAEVTHWRPLPARPSTPSHKGREKA